MLARDKYLLNIRKVTDSEISKRKSSYRTSLRVALLSCAWWWQWFHRTNCSCGIPQS